MDSSIDTSIRNDMRDHVKKLLFAIQEGNTAYNSFLGIISTFHNTIRTHSGKLREDTLGAVNSFALLINTLLQDALDLETTTVHIIEETKSDFSELLRSRMSRLTITDDQNFKSSSGHPAYIRPSYEWLLSNLHNPYPSKDMKKEIARQTKCSVKDIDAWFVDTRKRIGWNKLRKTRFSNKQDKIIAAATLVFKPRPSTYSDDLTTSLISEMNSDVICRAEFLLIERLARSLYSDRFPDLATSSLAQKCLQHDTSSDRDKGEEDHQPQSQVPSIHDVVPYPTPEPSPAENLMGPSPPPTPPPSLEVISSFNRKRRQSPLEANEEDSMTRPSKRLRTPDNQVLDISCAANSQSQFTPVTILEEIHRVVSPSMSHLPTTDVAEASEPKRKRRLSDGGTQGPAKRPHNALFRPRVQAVSDPLPLKKTVTNFHFDDCLQGSLNFEEDLSYAIPSPATTAECSLSSTPVNVELYQYDFSPHNALCHLPETSADLDNLEVQNSLSSSSIPCPPEPFSYQDAVFDLIASSNVQFDLIPAPSYRTTFPIESPNVSDDFVLFPDSELLSSVPGYIPDPSPMPGDSYGDLNGLDYDISSFVKTPVLGDSNHSVRQSIHQSEETKDKRARAQAIRKELAQLIAEGL